MDLKARAKKLKTDIPAIFLALKDKETSLVAKIFAEITVVYALSSIDFVPDFIPVLGYLDDVILLTMLVALTIKWYYAIPIIFIWVLIIVLILNIVF